MRQKQVLNCITPHDKHGRDPCDNPNPNNHELSIAAQISIQPFKARFKFQKFEIAVVSISRANKTASHNFSEYPTSNCDQHKASILPDQTSKMQPSRFREVPMSRNHAPDTTEQNIDFSKVKLRHPNVYYHETKQSKDSCQAKSIFYKQKDQKEETRRFYNETIAYHTILLNAKRDLGFRIALRTLLWYKVFSNKPNNLCKPVRPNLSGDSDLNQK